MSGIYDWFGIVVPAEERYHLIHAAGFRSVMLYWSDEFSPIDEAVRLARSARLAIANGHLPFQGINVMWEAGEPGDRFTGMLSTLIQAAGTHAVPILVLHPSESTVPPPVSQVGLDRFFQLINEAEVQGVSLALENVRSRDHFDTVLQTFPSLGICYDSGHNHAVTKDPALLQPYRGRVLTVHLHDNHGVADEHLLPFDGSIAWKAEMDMLKSAEYTGPVLLEAIASEGEEPLGYLKKCKQAAERLQVWLKD